MNRTLLITIGLATGIGLVALAASASEHPVGPGGLPPKPVPKPEPKPVDVDTSPGALAREDDTVEVPAAFLYPNGMPGVVPILNPGELVDSVLVVVRHIGLNGPVGDRQAPTLLQGDATHIITSSPVGGRQVRALAGLTPTEFFSRGAVINRMPRPS